MVDPLALLDACEHCYAYPMYKAGPQGRDSASLEQIDGQTVLVFGGTKTEGRVAFFDWLNDLRATLVFREGFPGLVHAGFEDSLHRLLMLLPRFDDPPAPVITGHSKGGALALLMGMYLYQRFGVRSKVVLFAPPMAGNADFAHAANEALDIDTYINPHDIVPKLPPVEYKHAGYLITPSERWTQPHGIVENHSLETGYRPWIEMDRPPAQSARQVA